MGDKGLTLKGEGSRLDMIVEVIGQSMEGEKYVYALKDSAGEAIESGKYFPENSLWGTPAD